MEGGGLKGRGEVDLIKTGGEDWRDKVRVIFALVGLGFSEVSDTLLVGGRFLLLEDKDVGDTGGVIDLLVVNLRRVSKYITQDEYKVNGYNNETITNLQHC